jgi:hypothetical protein
VKSRYFASLAGQRGVEVTPRPQKRSYIYLQRHGLRISSCPSIYLVPFLTSFHIFLQTFLFLRTPKMFLLSTMLLGLLQQSLAQSTFDPFTAATTDLTAPTGICNDEKYVLLLSMSSHLVLPFATFSLF